MAEDRVDKLEGEVNNLTSMVSEQQKMMKEIQGMLAAMHTRFDNLSSNHSNVNSHKRDEGERSSSRFNSGPSSSHSSIIPRVTKIDFPRYNGNEDPTSWICRVEQFFEFQNIVEEEKNFIGCLPFGGGSTIMVSNTKGRRESDHLAFTQRRLVHTLWPNVIPRVTKLDFPCFNGNEDPTSWICHVEQFFEFQNIVEEEKNFIGCLPFGGGSTIMVSNTKGRRESDHLAFTQRRLVHTLWPNRV